MRDRRQTENIVDDRHIVLKGRLYAEGFMAKVDIKAYNTFIQLGL